MNDSKDHKAAAEPPLDCRVGRDLTMPAFLRNQKNLAAEKDAEIARLRERLIYARAAVAQARIHFLAGEKEGGWTLCALRIALDTIDDGLNATVPNA